MKKKRGCFRWILIVVGIFIIFGIFGALLSDDSPDTPTKSNNAESSAVVATEKPVEIAPDYQTIENTVADMTEIQWKEYLDSIEGMKVEDWTGWVVDVDKSFGDYRIWVDMDDPSEILSAQDVYLYGITEEEAAKVNKDAKITFSGIIDRANEFLGSVSLSLKNIEYQLDS